MSVQSDFVDGLREMADFLETHPDLIPEYTAAQIDLFAWTKEEFAELGAKLGACEKSSTASYLMMSRQFGPHSLVINVNKSATCQKVQTGTRTETIEVPASARVSVGASRGDLKYEVEVPVFGWECPESFRRPVTA